MKVSEIMTRGVISLRPEMPMRKAAEMMLKFGVSGFPVLDRGRLVGMLTEGDFMNRVETGTERRLDGRAASAVSTGELAAEYVQARGRTVGAVMSRNVITIDEDASLEEAVELMRQHDVKRLPVVNGAGMVGMLSRVDLLHAFVVAARGSAEPSNGDDAIRECLVAELRDRTWAPGPSFHVEVTDGVVELYGAVWDARERAAVHVAAENIAGVKEVRDHIAIADLKPSA